MNNIAFWFRRDLRLDDNTGLLQAIKTGNKILAVFIFDINIIDELEPHDPRINFIYDTLRKLNSDLSKLGSGILVRKGDPIKIWEELIIEYKLESIYSNHDYEPYAKKRDEGVRRLCKDLTIGFNTYKDQVIFEENEIVKADGNPYTVFTPYKKKWLEQFKTFSFCLESNSLFPHQIIRPEVNFPEKADIGIKNSSIAIKPYHPEVIPNYEQYRNFPSKDLGSYLGPHLRFGTLSIRKLAGIAAEQNEIFLSELIWREFFMQILFHFPNVVSHSFKTKYDKIQWINNRIQFKKWCHGETGYPMVDAGMRQLNQTGYMHNRLRMITASFLVKHLLIDWRWGEAYFASNLLDYELSSNNGNWQWAAGTGCDAAPYFRIFNPTEQQKKFDPNFEYIKKWVHEFGTKNYPGQIIDHAFARNRAIAAYKNAIGK